MSESNIKLSIASCRIFEKSIETFTHNVGSTVGSLLYNKHLPPTPVEGTGINFFVH